MYHWWMGLNFKEVNIKCKNRRSLNEMIQQDCCYWCQQLFSFSWYDQCSLIGAQLSWIKSFWSRGKEGHIFLLHIFLVFGFFSNGDGYLDTNIIKRLRPCLCGFSRKNADWGLGRFLKASANAWVWKQCFLTAFLLGCSVPFHHLSCWALTCSSVTRSGFGVVSDGQCGGL